MKRSGRRIAGPCLAALVVAGGVTVDAQPLAAHHSMAMYDQGKVMTLIGTVVEYQWTNPHVYVMVRGTVDMDDDPALWRVESVSPSSLVRLGWSATALRTGDRVTIALNPSRDPREHSGLLLKITLIDTGQELATAALDPYRDPAAGGASPRRQTEAARATEP